MKSYSTDALRNLALAGHNDTGKTTLVSGLLFAAGAVNRFLRVEDGNTVTDFDEEEVQRKISIQLGLAHAEWKGHKVNFFDTPGFAMFISETLAGLKGADALAIVVNGVAGVEVHTSKIFSLGEQQRIPTCIVINKMDKDYADDEKVVAQLKEKFGNRILPIQVPIGKESGFHGVVDLVRRKAFLSAGDGTPGAKEAEIPADMKARADAAFEQLVEKVAEGDEKLMEKFFEAGTLSPQDMLAGLKKGIAKRDIIPVLFTSAAKLVGLPSLLDFIVDLMPSPAVRPWEGKNPVSGEPLSFEPKEDAPASAYVIKTISDLFAGRITIFKVISGTFHSDGTYYNSNHETPERFGAINAIQGKTLTPVGRPSPATSWPWPS